MSVNFSRGNLVVPDIWIVMNPATYPPQQADSPFRQLASICRADAAVIDAWFEGRSRGGARLCCLAIIISGGLYGYTLGCWRAPQMGVYVAIKLPLLIFVVLLVNGIINGMLALLLGSELSFRQSLMMSLVGFTIVTLILGALSPITFFMVFNAPAVDSPDAARWHQLFMLTHTLVIAYAGVIGNHKAYRLLVAVTGEVAIAKRTFTAWLAVNLLAGAQLSYVMRPFFGNPLRPVEWLRPDAFNGSFPEVLTNSALQILN
ncbi:MAG: hypothetical protein ACI8XO_000401 [Verrucomicrobiales bacterium]|jgi:hypothetical protein